MANRVVAAPSPRGAPDAKRQSVKRNRFWCAPRPASPGADLQSRTFVHLHSAGAVNIIRRVRHALAHHISDRLITLNFAAPLRCCRCFPLNSPIQLIPGFVCLGHAYGPKACLRLSHVYMVTCCYRRATNSKNKDII